MCEFNPRCLTIIERKEVEYLRDMLNGDINRMCVTDDLVELGNNATYALKNDQLPYRHSGEQIFRSYAGGITK